MSDRLTAPLHREGRLSRRAFVRAGIVLAVTTAIAGPLAIARSGGYGALLPGREGLAPLRALSAWQAVVVDRAAARVLQSDRAPGDATVPSPVDVDVVGFVDGYVADLPSDLRRDLLRLLAYLEHVAPVASGHASRFSRLGPAAQDRILAALEASQVDLLRGGFEAVKALLFMGYYRDPRAWAITGYDGPWVDRPKGGWR